jgi:hypothetical protein
MVAVIHLSKETRMAKNDKKNIEATDEDVIETVESGPEAEESIEGLVKVHKDGAHLHVHPTTVKDHLSAGWMVA